jgi:uncharacterized membrane protein
LKKPSAHKRRKANLKGSELILKLNKTDEAVIKALKAEGKELSLAELTEKTGEPSKKIFKSLRKLFEHEMVDTLGRKYRLLKEKPDASKKDAPEVPDEE